jgi:hypothetical protein
MAYLERDTNLAVCKGNLRRQCATSPKRWQSQVNLGYTEIRAPIGAADAAVGAPRPGAAQSL